MHFCDRVRADVKSDLGESCKPQEVMKELGSRWKAIKESDEDSDKNLIRELQSMVAKE